MRCFTEFRAVQQIDLGAVDRMKRCTWKKSLKLPKSFEGVVALLERQKHRRNQFDDTCPTKYLMKKTTYQFPNDRGDPVGERKANPFDCRKFVEHSLIPLSNRNISDRFEYGEA